MIIPGIRTISFISCDQLPADAELTAMAGGQVSISDLLFTPAIFCGSPSLELSDSNENNGTNRSAKLTFTVPGLFTHRRVAFLITTSHGLTLLIGSRDCVPAIATKAVTTDPSTKNAEEVSVELSGAMPWIQIEGEWHQSEEYHPVGFQPWRVITDQEIDDIINRLKASK
jgi:hypothetical protein